MEGVDPTEDAVGRTSARLLAAGVPSSERLDALQVLAVLDASADGAGRVRRPLDDLADEFELRHDVVFRSLDHLERAGAVVRDGATVLLPRYGEEAVGGLLLADFLADVRSALEDEPVRPSRPRLVARAAAGLVAAAALVAVALVVPGGSGSTTTTFAAPSASRSGDGVTDRDDDVTVTTAVDPAPTTDGLTGPGAATTPSPSTPSDGASASAASATTVAGVACPAGGPSVALAPESEAIGETAATVGSTPSLSGTATNATAHDLTITAMIARSGTTEGHLVEPLFVPAGQTVTWTVPADTLNVLDPPGAVVEEWAWTDPTLHGCPS